MLRTTIQKESSESFSLWHGETIEHSFGKSGPSSFLVFLAVMMVVVVRRLIKNGDIFKLWHGETIEHSFGKSGPSSFLVFFWR